MKKIRSLTFTLALIFVMFFTPNIVHAENVVRSFSGTIDYYQQQGYYYGMPDVHNGINGGYLVDETSSLSFPSSSYYLIRPIDTNVNFIYALKQMTINSSISVERGRYYTIALEINRGSYLKLGSEISSIYNITSDSECYSNVGTCSWSWGSNFQYMIITLVPNSNSSNYFIRIGNQANANKVLALNTYTMGSQGFRVIGASITNSNDAIDISPMINEQKETNKKLDDINNNINETNDQLESIGDTLANTDVPTPSLIDNVITNFDVISNGPISSLLQLPLRLLNVIYNNVGGSLCRTYTIGSLYGYELTIPCIHIEDYLGNDVYNLIDTILQIIIYYNVFLLIIHYFENATSLYDFFDDLYAPKTSKKGGNK